MELSGLSFRKVLVGTGWAISLLLCTIIGLENDPLTLAVEVMSPFIC